MQRDLVALPRDEPVAILFQHRRFRLPRYGMDTGEIRCAVQAFLADGRIACQLATVPDVPQVLALGTDDQG